MYNICLESTNLQTQNEKIQNIIDQAGSSSKLISEFYLIILYTID